MRVQTPAFESAYARRAESIVLLAWLPIRGVPAVQIRESRRAACRSRSRGLH